MSSKLCKNCGKPPLAEHAGSVTSFFFQHNYCQCAVEQNIRANGKAKGSTSGSPLCPNCGKSRPTSKRAGSFTSFLFKELRCSCPGPNPAKPNSSDALEKIRVSRAGKERTQTAHRLAQKKQFTESLKNRKPDSGESAAQVILSANTIIGGTYRILSLIGMGGMGVVYLVEQTSLHKQFALKVLSPDLVNEQNWQRFKAEAKTMASLNHPSFVNVYDLGIHAGSTPFYSMDYLTGRSLEEILVDEGPLKLEAALNIFIEVLNGLAYAHRNGIIHRDIKPANIMLCTTNGATQVKILDFGISKFIGSDANKLQSMTMAGDVFGSPFYMSPEQCAGEAVDARSDIYSIGCTLFEVLTGYVPFEGSTSLETMIMHQEDKAPQLGDVLPDKSFSKSLEAIVATCLAKSPRDRYQFAKEIVLDLERLRAGKEIEPSSPAFNNLITLVKAKARRYERSEADLVNDYERENSTLFPAKLTKVVFLPFAVTSILILAISTVLYATRNEPTKETVRYEPGGTKLEATTTDSLSSLIQEQEPKYFSKIDDGGNLIQFMFPKDQSIGKISADPNLNQFQSAQEVENFTYSAGNRSQTQSAQGLVNIPVKHHIYFYPNATMMTHPELFDSFRPEELYSLTISESIGRSELTKAMHYIAKLNGIRAIDLSGSRLRDEHFIDLNKMTNLESLNVIDTEITEEELAKFKRLKKLRALQCNYLPKPTKLLEALQGSINLQLLTLDNSDNALSESDAKLIASCKHIKTLRLRGVVRSDKVLKILSNLPDLEYINLADNSVSDKAMQDFKKAYLPKLIHVFEPEAVRLNKNVKDAFGRQAPMEWLREAGQ